MPSAPTRASIIISTTPSKSQSSSHSHSPGGLLSPTVTATATKPEGGSPVGSCLVKVEERRSYFVHLPVSQLADISEGTGGTGTGANTVTTFTVSDFDTYSNPKSNTANSSFSSSPIHRSKSACDHHIITPAEPHSRSRSAQDLYSHSTAPPATPVPGSSTPTTITSTSKNARHQSLKPSSPSSSDWRHLSIGASPISNDFPAGWLQSLLQSGGDSAGVSNGIGSANRRNRPRQKILFYHKHDPHYGFTNFSAHPVYYKGKRYPTSEHLFQSFKFQEHRPYLAEHIRTCSERPSVALSEARRFQPEVRRDWKRVNVQKMDEALYHKFTQHHDLKQELLDTGDAELIEDSDKDSFWGVGADRTGRNELGKALERLREKLRADEV